MRRKTPPMEPAFRIVSELGGPNKVSEITGVHRTKVCNWTRAKEVGGSGGRIPQTHIPILISAARNQGIPLSLDDFFPSQPASNGHAA